MPELKSRQIPDYMPSGYIIQERLFKQRFCIYSIASVGGQRMSNTRRGRVPAAAGSPTSCSHSCIPQASKVPLFLWSHGARTGEVPPLIRCKNLEDPPHYMHDSCHFISAAMMQDLTPHIFCWVEIGWLKMLTHLYPQVFSGM